MFWFFISFHDRIACGARIANQMLDLAEFPASAQVNLNWIIKWLLWDSVHFKNYSSDRHEQKLWFSLERGRQQRKRMLRHFPRWSRFQRNRVAKCSWRYSGCCWSSPDVSDLPLLWTILAYPMGLHFRIARWLHPARKDFITWQTKINFLNIICFLFSVHLGCISC